MAVEVLEIVELEGGEVALRRVDDQGAEPVISIRFSPETLQQCESGRIEIARAMIAAGVQVIANARERAASERQPPILH